MFYDGTLAGSSSTLPTLVRSGGVSSIRYRLNENSSTRNKVVLAPQAAADKDELYRLSKLPSLRLIAPIEARLSCDAGEWVLEAINLPLYGSGASFAEAREMLAREIESLWDDLNENADYADEWIGVKRYLDRVISR